MLLHRIWIVCFALACCSAMAKPWVPNTNYSSSFEQMWFSDEGWFALPIHGNYLLYKTPMDAKFTEFCSLFAPNATCADYFCSATSIAANATRQHLALMQNYCYYCLNEGNRTRAEFATFRALVQANASSCPWFVPFKQDHCGSNGVPLLYYRLLNYSSHVEPFYCYCTEYDKFGYKCDLWTAFFNTFTVEGLQFVAILFGLVASSAILILVYIPDLGTRWKQWRISPTKWFFNEWSAFFDIKMQCGLLPFLACFFAGAEGVYEQMWYSSAIRVFRDRLPTGLFIIAAFFFTLASYGSTLVMWSNVYANTQNVAKDISLDGKHKVALTMWYTGLIAIGCVYGILFTVIRSYTVLFGAIGVTLLAFVIMFPPLFSIYAIRLFFVLSKSNKGQQASKRITIIVVLENIIIFCILYPICLPIIIAYIFGWDISSYGYYIMRVFLLQCVCIIQASMNASIHFGKLHMLKFYGCIKRSHTARKYIPQPETPKLTSKASIRDIVKKMIEDEANSLTINTTTTTTTDAATPATPEIQQQQPLCPKEEKMTCP